MIPTPPKLTTNHSDSGVEIVLWFQSRNRPLISESESPRSGPSGVSQLRHQEGSQSEKFYYLSTNGTIYLWMDSSGAIQILPLFSLRCRHQRGTDAAGCLGGTGRNCLKMSWCLLATTRGSSSTMYCCVCLRSSRSVVIYRGNLRSRSNQRKRTRSESLVAKPTWQRRADRKLTDSTVMLLVLKQWQLAVNSLLHLVVRQVQRHIPKLNVAQSDRAYVLCKLRLQAVWHHTTSFFYTPPVRARLLLLLTPILHQWNKLEYAVTYRRVSDKIVQPDNSQLVGYIIDNWHACYMHRVPSPCDTQVNLNECCMHAG